MTYDKRVSMVEAGVYILRLFGYYPFLGNKSSIKKKLFYIDADEMQAVADRERAGVEAKTRRTWQEKNKN